MRQSLAELGSWLRAIRSQYLFFALTIFFLGWLFIPIQRVLETPDLNIGGTPISVVGVILGLAILLAGSVNAYLKLYRTIQPTISLVFSSDSGGITITRQDILDASGHIAGHRNVVFVRVRAVATSKRGPRVCAAFLTRIEKRVVGELSTSRTANLHDGLQLPWSWIGRVEAAVHPGIDRNIDVVVAAEGSAALELQAPEPYSMMGFLAGPGEYDFHLRVVADGVVQQASLRVFWNGDWSSVRAELHAK